METKPLLYGIIGFILGGLVVSIAATTFEKPQDTSPKSSASALEGKTGDAFDQAFITEMISHHEGAIEMAQMSEGQAKHQEIKDLSKAIVSAQQKEIEQMRQWQQQWNYPTTEASHEGM